MVDIAVINASPLIFLSRGRHLELLRHFAVRIVVPQSVALELSQKGPNDITAMAVASTVWLEVVPATQVPDAITEWGLGAGESAVLAYAWKNNCIEAIIDDLAARRCASCLNIPVRGTLGIVLAAKRRGVIPSARAVMNDLIQNGMYLSKTVLDAALSRVGE